MRSTIQHHPSKAKRAPSPMSARVLAELPALSAEEVLAALNAAGLQPDPDELREAYVRDHPATPEALSVLLALQLATRAGRWIDQRALAEWAGVAPSTVSRVTDRLEAIGVLVKLGGARRRREGGQVRRDCLRYRWAWTAAVELGPQRVHQARLWRWAVSAGVPKLRIASCLRHGQLHRLELLVRAARIPKVAKTTRVVVSQPSAPEPKPGGVVVARPVVEASTPAPRRDGAIALADLLRERLEHGFPNSKSAVSGPIGSEGYGSPSQRLVLPDTGPSTSALVGPESVWKEMDVVVHADRDLAVEKGPGEFDGDNKVPAAQLLRQRVLELATSVGDNAPRATWRMVEASARAAGVRVGDAVNLYQRCVHEARVESRIGAVRRPAAWAAAGFRREIEQLGRAA